MAHFFLKHNVLFLTLLIFYVYTISIGWCENNNPDCHNAGCIGDLTCTEPGQQFTPNKTLGGCCPACVQYTGENDQCSEILPPCLPGLECIGGICQVSSQPEDKCASYTFRDLLWSPKCEVDGTYSQVQCKGEVLTGRCFCYSANGKRMFGQQWSSDAVNMTCACSRKVEALLATGRKDVTIHCSEDGNFEELQCDDGVCWCADPKHGDALAEVVPEAMLKMLPCYNATTVGDTYLRKCDSALSALNKIRDEMSKHGTLGDAFIAKNCGLDGSYGEYQYEDSIRYCTWRDNSKIGSYMTSELPVSVLNCNCARDSIYYPNEGFGFTMQCTGYGNYITLQQLDQPTCVDLDGYAYMKPTMSETGQDICEPLP